MSSCIDVLRIYRHYCIQYTSNENQSSQSVNCQIQHAGIYLEISLLDCLTTKIFEDFSRTFPKFQQNSKFQDFLGLFSNFRTFQDYFQISGLSRTLFKFQDFLGLFSNFRTFQDSFQISGLSRTLFKFQDFPGLFSNSRTFQDSFQISGLSRTFQTWWEPWYQGVRNVRFSENLACFVFLKHPF